MPITRHSNLAEVPSLADTSSSRFVKVGTYPNLLSLGSASVTLLWSKINRGYLFFSVKDRNLFHRVDTIGNIFTSGAAKSENITDGVHEMK